MSFLNKVNKNFNLKLKIISRSLILLPQSKVTLISMAKNY
ncbi:MAG: hypothetical protein PWP35_1550 [Bacteroidales bacterium]|jgi:hypothetical protein|nr:hypothetical protein [Bacteroidales bacterium]